MTHSHGGTIRKAIKIGFGVLAFTAASSAAAGYLLAKRDMADRDDGGGEGMDGGDTWGGTASKASALKEMVSAGRDMKRAWDRFEKSAKVILVRVTEEKGDDGGEDDDEDDDDDE